MKKIDMAYLAGLFDGDGCISINYHRKSGYGSLQCLLTSTDIPSIQHFQNVFGGYKQMLRRRKTTWRDQYQWAIAAQNALDFLRVLLPYLKIKREQALIGIEYQQLLNNNGRRRIKKEERQKREYLRKKLSELKII